MWEALFPQTESPPTPRFRKSGPLPAALSRPPRLNKPCQQQSPAGAFLTLMRPTHLLLHKRGALPRHIQVCPPTRRALTRQLPPRCI